MGRADYTNVLYIRHRDPGVHDSRAPAALPLGWRAEPRLLPRLGPHTILHQSAGL